MFATRRLFIKNQRFLLNKKIHRKFSNQPKQETITQKEPVTKEPPKDDDLPPWFTKTLLSLIIFPVIGASIGAIQGSYEYYTKGRRYDNTDVHVMNYSFYGFIWPLYIPYGICRGIGYLLAKQPIRIKFQKED